MQTDREILRDLAKLQLETANSQKNLERIREWKEHNAMQGKRPMIHIETGTFEQELIPGRLKCTDQTARRIERDIHHAIINLREYDDDKIVTPYFQVGVRQWFNPFGHMVTSHNAVDSDGNTSLGHQFEHFIEDLEEDYNKLKDSEFGVDMEGTNAYLNAANDYFGDILPAKLEGGCLYAVPTQQIVHLMSMENMFVAMYDYPDLFKEMMSRIADDYIRYFKYLESNKYLMPTVDFQGVGQGTWAFTNELKKDGDLKTTDLWGFMDSQETVGVSAEMFKEFIFPCYEKISHMFGLLSYGCCEPVDAFWSMIKTLPNLRKVSISPWCNQEFMANELRGSKVIFHRKPSPNYLGVGKNLDEEAFRAHISETIKTAKGCKLEITQRDVYSVNHDVSKVKRYVEIIREEIAKFW